MGLSGAVGNFISREHRPRRYFYPARIPDLWNASGHFATRSFRGLLIIRVNAVRPARPDNDLARRPFLSPAFGLYPRPHIIGYPNAPIMPCNPRFVSLFARFRFFAHFSYLPYFRVTSDIMANMMVFKFL